MLLTSAAQLRVTILIAGGAGRVFSYPKPKYRIARCEEETMSRAEIEKVVRGVYEARRTNDLETVRDYFLPDSRLIINGSPEASEVALSVSGEPRKR